MPRPDRTIVRALKRIDPLLRVMWMDRTERWGIFHDLPPCEQEDVIARRVAKEVWYKGMEDGYQFDYNACLQMAYQRLEDQKLVHMVQNADGSYRPLDARVIDKFRRMDWMRRNWWLKDWLHEAQTQQETLEATRQKAKDAPWEDIKTDGTLKRMLMGQYRSVVNEWVPPAPTVEGEAS